MYCLVTYHLISLYVPEQNRHVLSYLQFGGLFLRMDTEWTRWRFTKPMGMASFPAFSLRRTNLNTDGRGLFSFHNRQPLGLASFVPLVSQYIPLFSVFFRSLFFSLMWRGRYCSAWRTVNWLSIPNKLLSLVVHLDQCSQIATTTMRALFEYNQKHGALSVLLFFLFKSFSSRCTKTANKVLDVILGIYYI